MLAGALGTYAAALILVAASTAVGAGIVAATGRREWSWTAPAVGLAAVTVVAWWTVRLPGHGLTALLCIAAVAVAGAWLAAVRLDGIREALRRGALPLAAALVVASIPFVAEGHFGVLGSGFNVDMSQHLFAASWLSDPAGPAPGLFEQGYPLGPHALTVATGEVSGELTTAFSGITIAAPALLALTALGACGGITRWRSSAIALLTAFAYLAATYLAQGSFKELFEATFLVGFALWLSGIARGEPGGSARSWRLGLVPGVLAAGALYAYSGPGLAWLAGTVVLWAAFELVRRRGEPAAGLVRLGLPAVAAGMAVALVLAIPELDRITDFGGSVGTVSEKAEANAPEDQGGTLLASGEGDYESNQSVIAGERDARSDEPEFDNDLGNLFGQISPLEAFGVWPSGDFRVAPGDGAVPAVVFYLGALLGAAGLAIGIAAAVRRGETALLAALAAAAAIWLAARVASTPYTAAKALEMIAPVAMLISARGLLDPEFLTGLRGRAQILRAAVATAFVAGAALSSALALANAPVGPREYTPGVTELSDRFAGSPTLILIPEDILADEHGEEFYGWELRRASEVEVRGADAASGSAPTGFRYVVVVGNEGGPPFDDVTRLAEADGVTLWQVEAAK